MPKRYAMSETPWSPPPEQAPAPPKRANTSMQITDDIWGPLGIALFVLCLGLAWLAPGILLVLLVVATPAFVRTLIAYFQKQPAEQVRGPWKLLNLFFVSVGMAVMVGLAAIVAFAAVCVVTGYFEYAFF